MRSPENALTATFKERVRAAQVAASTPLRRPRPWGLDPERVHWLGRHLRDADFDRLRGLGVPGPRVNWTCGAFDPLLRHAVVFRRGGRFDFARDLRGEDVEPVGAYTVIARGSYGEPVDVVAWQPTTGDLGSWLGRAGLLGEDFPAAGTFDDPLPVHPDFVSWLASGRRGVVVVIERLARSILLDAGSLQASDIAHGEALNAMLRKQRLPKILVPETSVARVAA